jgi:hypothetical protein
VKIILLIETPIFLDNLMPLRRLGIPQFLEDRLVFIGCLKLFNSELYASFSINRIDISYPSTNQLTLKANYPLFSQLTSNSYFVFYNLSHSNLKSTNKIKNNKYPKCKVTKEYASSAAPTQTTSSTSRKSPPREKPSNHSATSPPTEAKAPTKQSQSANSQAAAPSSAKPATTTP